MSTTKTDPNRVGCGRMVRLREPPEGCQEIPGFILDIFDGSAWLTQTGQVTDKWEERGIWPTEEAASAALETFFKPNSDDEHAR